MRKREIVRDRERKSEKDNKKEIYIDRLKYRYRI